MTIRIYQDLATADWDSADDDPDEPAADQILPLSTWI